MRPLRRAVPGHRNAVLASWGVASMLLSPRLCHAETALEHTWGGTARIERFHTEDLFPGVAQPRPDWGTRVSLKMSVRASVGKGLRILPWGKLVAERYDRWSARNLEQWTVGTDLRASRYRLRIYGERTDGELSFPARDSDGALLDRSALGGDVRIDLTPGWRVNARAEYERDDFVPTYDERDGHRWSFRTGLERNLSGGRMVSLAHEYRRGDSVTRLFSYQQNALRALVDWPLPAGVTGELELQLGLRNYRTGQSFAENFGRGDTRALASTTLGHAIAGPVVAECYGSWRRRVSTRPGKSYDVSMFGIALSATRK